MMNGQKDSSPGLIVLRALEKALVGWKDVFS